MSEILFAPVTYTAYSSDETLPARFGRMLDKSLLKAKVKGKRTVVKMHVGRGIGYTTIHPVFVKILIDKLIKWGAQPYIADNEIEDAGARGYREEYLGCPIVEVCSVTGKYYYSVKEDFKGFKNLDIGGNIRDAEFLIDLSHVKGHGCCGFGGACKNLAMGCVTDRTRQQIHGLEGGLNWDADKCTRCEACVKGCNHSANRFKSGKYSVNYHNCTLCQHCAKVCPTGAITLTGSNYEDFQTGMAIATRDIVKGFGENAYYINFLTNITALCDCWGLTTPSLVPDIGIMASWDMVALERASVDSIKMENFLLTGAPVGHKMEGSGHLLERLHGKNPFLQIDKLEQEGLGSQEYNLKEIL